MSTINNYILDLLNDDMVSHGLLAQCVDQDKSVGRDGRKLEWREVIEELLSEKKVEIGVAKIASSLDHVEFIAWKGTIGERIARAVESVESIAGPDREFAYWLCLPENVDRFEGEE